MGRSLLKNLGFRRHLFRNSFFRPKMPWDPFSLNFLAELVFLSKKNVGNHFFVVLIRFGRPRFFFWFSDMLSEIGPPLAQVHRSSRKLTEAHGSSRKFTEVHGSFGGGAEVHGSFGGPSRK